MPNLPQFPPVPQPPQAPQPPAPPLPPACSDCITTTQLAHPGAQPQQVPSQMFRAPDGKMRIDSGATSVITDPAQGKAVILDHLKKTAHIMPLPQAPQAPGAPQMPQLPGGIPGLPSNLPKPAQVEDLGKGFIEGHEVEGKKFTFQPPQPPEMPQLPKPNLPGLPGAPQLPQASQAPPMPTVAEVWSSTKTKMPVLTKLSGPFGQQICHCKPGSDAPAANPALFQPPPGYKITEGK